jgi:hypothetical protein
VEAWIETGLGETEPEPEEVASRVEAWIETNTITAWDYCYTVASRVEAWIETNADLKDYHGIASPPAWRRGLKPDHLQNRNNRVWSPPAWRRGLKHPSAAHPAPPARRLPRGGVD